MRSLFAFALIFTAVSAQADTSVVRTRIESVLAPLHAGQTFQILSSIDGRVYDAEASVASGLRADSVVDLVVDGDRAVAFAAVESADSSAEIAKGETDEVIKSDPPMLGYEPTQLATMAETATLFDELEYVTPKSQCYQRAMIWTYAMYNTHQIKSQKVFLFFTQRFIREYRYKWWFHVAPVVIAEGKEVVLDPTFTKSPLVLGDWTNEFMLNKAPCAVANSYTQYENNQSVEYCYTLMTPMYYYQPRDMEALDLRGEKITDFKPGDISHANAGRRKRGWWPF
jgi:hypothetical protein